VLGTLTLRSPAAAADDDADVPGVAGRTAYGRRRGTTEATAAPACRPLSCRSLLQRQQQRRQQTVAKCPTTGCETLNVGQYQCRDLSASVTISTVTRLSVHVRAADDDNADVAVSSRTELHASAQRGKASSSSARRRCCVVRVDHVCVERRSQAGRWRRGATSEWLTPLRR